jgi:hypothetical protein
MNPYTTPKLEQAETKSGATKLGMFRTGLFAMSCVGMAIRDLPQAEYAGLAVGLVLTGISWGAIRFRWMYWIGVTISGVLMLKIVDLFERFADHPDLWGKIMYGGVVVPMFLASAIYLIHLFVSGRTNE